MFLSVISISTLEIDLEIHTDFVHEGKNHFSAPLVISTMLRKLFSGFGLNPFMKERNLFKAPNVITVTHRKLFSRLIMNLLMNEKQYLNSHTF